jgi:hypothetical protein
MKRASLIFIPALFVTMTLVSCTTGSESVQKRQDRRTEHYGEGQNRREIREDARQERTDAWYDRHMN